MKRKKPKGSEMPWARELPDGKVIVMLPASGGTFTERIYEADEQVPLEYLKLLQEWNEYS